MQGMVSPFLSSATPCGFASWSTINYQLSAINLLISELLLVTIQVRVVYIIFIGSAVALGLFPLGCNETYLAQVEGIALTLALNRKSDSRSKSFFCR